MTCGSGSPRRLGGCRRLLVKEGREVMLGLVSAWSASWEDWHPLFPSQCGEPVTSKNGLFFAELRTRAPLAWAQCLGLVPASTIVQSSCVPAWPSSPGAASRMTLVVKWRSRPTGGSEDGNLPWVVRPQTWPSTWTLCKVGHAVPVIPDHQSVKGLAGPRASPVLLEQYKRVQLSPQAAQRVPSSPSGAGHPAGGVHSLGPFVLFCSGWAAGELAVKGMWGQAVSTAKVPPLLPACGHMLPTPWGWFLWTLVGGEVGHRCLRATAPSRPLNWSALSLCSVVTFCEWQLHFPKKIFAPRSHPLYRALFFMPTFTLHILRVCVPSPAGIFAPKGQLFSTCCG